MTHITVSIYDKKMGMVSQEHIMLEKGNTHLHQITPKLCGVTCDLIEIQALTLSDDERSHYEFLQKEFGELQEKYEAICKIVNGDEEDCDDYEDEIEERRRLL